MKSTETQAASSKKPVPLAAEADQWKAMSIHSIAVTDPNSRPLLILKDEGDTVRVPVWLLPVEAGAVIVQTQMAKAQSTPEGLTQKVLQSLNIEIKECYLTHVEGHVQYGFLKLANHPHSDKLYARAGEMLPLVSFKKIPIFVTEEFIHASRDIDAELFDGQKEVDSINRGQRIKTAIFH